MTEPAPLPVTPPSPTPDDAPFWAALAQSRVVLPRCRSCQTWIWYPRTFCPACHTPGVEWLDVSGRGRVYSFTVSTRGVGSWADRAPYVIAYVELDEGPRVLTNLVDVAPDDVSIGQAVTAVVQFDGDAPALRFAPI